MTGPVFSLIATDAAVHMCKEFETLKILGCVLIGTQPKKSETLLAHYRMPCYVQFQGNHTLTSIVSVVPLYPGIRQGLLPAFYS